MLSEKGCQVLSSVNRDVVFVDGFSLYLFHPLLRLFTEGHISNVDTSEQVLCIYLPLFMCVWRSEDGVCELFLFFHRVSPGDQTWIVGVRCKCLYLLSSGNRFKTNPQPPPPGRVRGIISTPPLISS